MSEIHISTLQGVTVFWQPLIAIFSHGTMKRRNHSGSLKMKDGTLLISIHTFQAFCNCAINCIFWQTHTLMREKERIGFLQTSQRLITSFNTNSKIYPCHNKCINQINRKNDLNCRLIKCS